MSRRWFIAIAIAALSGASPALAAAGVKVTIHDDSKWYALNGLNPTIESSLGLAVPREATPFTVTLQNSGPSRLKTSWFVVQVANARIIGATPRAGTMQTIRYGATPEGIARWRIGLAPGETKRFRLNVVFSGPFVHVGSTFGAFVSADLSGKHRYGYRVMGVHPLIRNGKVPPPTTAGTTTTP